LLKAYGDSGRRVKISLARVPDTAIKTTVKNKASFSFGKIM